MKLQFRLSRVQAAACIRPARGLCLTAYAYRTSENRGSGKSEIEQTVDLHKLRSTIESVPIHHTQSSHGEGYHHLPETHGVAYYNPPLALLGQGALARAGDEIKKMGVKRALIVTDSVLDKLKATAALTDILDKIEVNWIIYDRPEPNPTIEQVAEGAKIWAEYGCDLLISFGGGSVHDAAKAIGILASNGGDLRTYEGVNRVPKPIPSLVTVNTTAGTGAEMTRFCSITDTERHVKMAIIDSKVTPAIAVNDPILMLGMPRSLTAATGMDALTHAIEAYLSTASTPVTDAAALQSVRLTVAYLRDAVRNGSDIKAREMMSYAEYLAGVAFNSASLGYVHALSHAIGGHYNLPHGICNAILLPVVCEFNAEAVPELFIDLAAAMGYQNLGEDGEKAAKLVVQEIKSLTRDIGIPTNFSQLGAVSPADFKELALNAMQDNCGMTNPRKPLFSEVVQLLEKAYTQGV